MPDISMCTNDKCFMRKSCYRFMAEPNRYSQSYIEFKPDENGQCDEFLKLYKVSDE